VSRAQPERPLIRVAFLRYPTEIQLKASASSAFNKDEVVGAIKNAVDIALPRTISEIQTLMGRKLPEVQVDVFTRDAEPLTVQASLIDFEHDIPAARFHFSVDHMSLGAENLETQNGQSHILIVSETGSTQGWDVVGAGTTQTASVCVSSSYWPTLVHDVLLDIATFHSTRGPHAEVQTIGQQRIYAARKAEFVLRNLTADTFFGPVRRGVAYNYLPLSLLARTDAGLDTTKYVNIWNEFHSQSGLYTFPRTPPTEEYILGHHPLSGQINRLTLLNTIKSLPPGSYYLAVGISLPKEPRNRERVLKLFGLRKGQWHTNRLRVMRWDELFSLRNLSQYVTIFPFEVYKWAD
jgi:hypothetical protein